MPIPAPGQDRELPPNPRAQSRFFARLPPEIRRQIYLHLFGDRRVHVEFDIGTVYHHKLGMEFEERREKWRWWQQ